MENVKEKLLKNKPLVIGIILTLVLLIGISYAWYTVTLTGTKQQVLKSGDLQLTLDESASEGISIEGAMPISDEEGLETTAYTFSLKNVGSKTVDYEIYLDDIEIGEGEERLSDQYIKYSLTKNSSAENPKLLSTTGTNPNRIIDSGVLKGGVTNTYTLKLWLDYDATNEAKNKTFAAKLRVEALQTGDIKGPTLTLGEVEATTDTITIPYTAEDASGVKEYICEYGTTEALGSTGEATETGCSITGVNPNTTYYYKITVIDNKLNETSKTGNTTTAQDRFVAAYTYNSSSCVTGEESGCVATTCYTNSASGSCPAGTIIKYKVNDSETKYFHVLHDDGSTITMQQRENTVYNKRWYNSTSNINSNGPTKVLGDLETATSGWSNVNDQTYTMGTTNFNGTNAYTGCSSYTTSSCTANTYTLGQRTGKARMITIQETSTLGCTTTQKSCPNWMNNYLYTSTSNGGTVDDSTQRTDDAGSSNYNYGYWTMSAYSSISASAWYVNCNGYVNNYNTSYTNYGARAVVVVNK